MTKYQRNLQYLNNSSVNNNNNNNINNSNDNCNDNDVTMLIPQNAIKQEFNNLLENQTKSILSHHLNMQQQQHNNIAIQHHQQQHQQNHYQSQLNHQQQQQQLQTFLNRFNSAVVASTNDSLNQPNSSTSCNFRNFNDSNESHNLTPSPIFTDYDENSLSSEEHVLAPLVCANAQSSRPCLTWACKACKKKSVAVDRRRAATMRERRRLRKVRRLEKIKLF